VHVDRTAAVWVTSASAPLAFRSKTWNFPIVGSFTYLGWFKRPEADEFAAKLAKQGLDVDVRGAGAFSTAGYFEDPIISTMIAPGDLGTGELADTVLHEMTHSTIFVRYQSTLNESVAMFVGRHLASEYLDETFGPAAVETRAYRSYQDLADDRGAKMKEAYDELVRLYATNKPDEEKLAEKSAIVTRLHDAIQFKRPINNATLIQFRTYHSGLDELATVLDRCDHDWHRFIRAVKGLETAHFERPQESNLGPIFRRVADAGCPR
jgi:predicted aminopeptidase